MALRRDWDTVREILLAIESSESGVRAADFDNEDEANYHMNLLIQGGIVEGQCVLSKTHIRSCRLKGMTWRGHELLDQIRHKSAWQRIKQAASDNGVSLTVEIIAKLATNLV